MWNFLKRSAAGRGGGGESFQTGLGTLPSAPPRQVPLRWAALQAQGALSQAQKG